GSGLADILLGSALYAPATFVIKGLMALIAAKLLKKGSMRIPRLLVSGIVMVAGYFAYECIIYGASVAVLSVPANLIQAVLGAVLGSIIIKGIETLQK
ncbi:MAG: ECF transporter S component, partial [Clostridia bacterium]|nr:ECF transporter S component [Clostridia bacterium]